MHVVCVVCRGCGVHEHCFMLEYELHCEYLLLLNNIWVVWCVEACAMSDVECLVGV